MWTFFTLDMLGVCSAIYGLLRKYCAPSVTLTVKLVTAYAWLTSMSIIVIVPLDCWTTLQNQSVPAIGVMWDICYWSTQVLTWILLPFFQVYSEAGDFTIKAKSWTSLKENLILYGSLGAACVVGVIILIATGQVGINDLAGLVIALSNTFALAAGLVLLGYGLVEVPRYLWKVSPEMSLKWCAHRAGKEAEKVMKSMADLEMVVTVVHANMQQMRRLDPLRHYMENISETAEKLSPVKPSEIAARNVDIDSLSAQDLEYNYDIQGMADLRRRLYNSIHDYLAAREQYRSVIVQAFELEAILKCISLKDYSPPSGTPNLLIKYSWLYKCVARPYVDKTSSIILVIVGLAVIWTEATVSSSVDLSPFSQIVFHSQGNQFGFQLVTLLPLVYLCVCMYYALFQITAFNYNRLVVHATTGAGLMQNGSLMCRFAAPTCWNYYYMLRLAGNSLISQKTVFEQRMGAMSVLPFLGSHLNLYLPILLGVIALLTALNMWDRLFHCCSSSRLRFTTDDVEDDYTTKGRSLIEREKEAADKGWAVGDVLKAARLEMEFPGYKPRPLKEKKEGLFGGLFSKKKGNSDEDDKRSILSASTTGRVTNDHTAKYKSSAAVEAASRWLQPTAQPSTTSAPAEPEFSSNNPFLSTSTIKGSLFGDRQGSALTSAKANVKPGLEATDAPSTRAKVGGKSGLDGIFSEIR